MTVKLTRFRPNSRGIQKLLTAPGVEADIGARALRIAAQVEAAGIQVERGRQRKDIPVTVTVTSGGSRARARVILDHPAGRAVEAKYGILAASVDAAGNA
jgi:NADH dehydrogenase FAD-containing subunit